MRNHTTGRTPGALPSADPPRRSPQFAHLSLESLRAYRRTLTTEEHRVSYWRRLVQARLDLVRSVDGGHSPTVESLSQVFAETRPTARGARLDILVSDDLPPLPDLLAVWSREPVPGQPQHNATLAHDLMKAESQLSAYRAALHRRLAAATAELIARYREEPSLCLSALPAPQPAAGLRRTL
jgi:hypothetical protein